MSKRVFYINCFTDPWIKVAQNLKKIHDFEAVYWIDYVDDISSENIPKTFPNAICHKDIPNAWRCIFPKDVEERARQTTIDINFLRQYASEELQGIKMMDRLDPDRHSFNFMERQRHWRNLIRNWTAAIELLKPDLVITPMLPHRVYDYALYYLCQYLGIPYIAFDHTQFNGRFMVLNNISTIGDLYKKDYEEFLKCEDILSLLPKDIKERYEKVQGDYLGAAPYYMKTEAIQQIKSSGLLNHIKNQILYFWRQRSKLFKKDGILKRASGMYYKWNANKSLEEKTQINILEYYQHRLKNNRYLKQLNKHYESLTVKPNYNEPYVIYFLHYQPEATTSPTGDIFVDQSLCADMILKNTPQDWKVYVKEHPHQFMYHREGATSRIKEFYHDLLRNPRVKLISTSESSFDLIEHCKAIGTVCGTVGWETIVRGKPVILFGISWYENYTPGVLRITDEASGQGMTEFINSYKFDEHSLLAYLASVGKNTKMAYYYKATHKSTLGISEDECVNNIVNAIINKYNEIK